jgi:hypothetical protein
MYGYNTFSQEEEDQQQLQPPLAEQDDGNNPAALEMAVDGQFDDLQQPQQGQQPSDENEIPNDFLQIEFVQFD